MTSLLRSAMSVFSGKIVRTVIGFIFTPILVRLISQEQYGVYATVLAAFSVVTLISRGGIFDATRKIVAENQSEGQQSNIVSTALVLSLALASIFSTIILVIAWTGVIPEQYTAYVPILLVCLVFINIFSVIRGAFHGLHTEHTTEILSVLQKGSYAILAIAFLLLGGELSGVFTGYSVSFIITAVVGLYMLIKRFHLGVPSKEMVRSHGKDLFGYGMTQLIGGLSALLLYQTDVLLVGYFQGSADTALYKAALLPAEYVWLVPSVIQAVFLQRTADLWSQNNISAISDQLTTGLKYAILSLSLFGIGLFPLSSAFLGIYFGELYGQGFAVLQILLCGTILFGISRVIIPIFQATGWIKYTESMTFVALIINLILNMYLIPRYGIIGAAIGTTISYSFMFFWAVAMWNRSTFNFPNPKLVIKWLVPQAGYAVVYIPIVYFSDLGDFMSLLVFPIFGLFTFVILNHLLGVINIYSIHSSFHNIF